MCSQRCVSDGEGEVQASDVSLVGLEEHQVLEQFGVQRGQVVDQIQEVVAPVEEGQEEVRKLRLCKEARSRGVQSREVQSRVSRSRGVTWSRYSRDR